MRPHRLPVLILAAACVTGLGFSAQATPLLGGEGSPRIVGGNVATQLLPGILSYGNTPERHNCTATLISPDWVLTATHCLKKDKLPVLRANNLEWTKGETHETTEIISAAGHDLTLLKLKTPITSIAPIKLADKEPALNDKVQIWGWGATECDFGKPVSPVLKYANVTVSGFTKDDIFRKGFFIFMQRGDGTAWQGDSGGPAVTPDGVQFGVAGTADCSSGNNSYTSVPKYRGWIKEKTGV